MATLLVGFDSAWTGRKSGGIAAVIRENNGSLRALGVPRAANFNEAEKFIREWQGEESPKLTIILIDQPIIVENKTRQRPVENIVSSCVSRRRGGMQPTSKSKTEMFGEGAPVWGFIDTFGGAGDPLASPSADAVVYETYPVLTIISQGWSLKDSRPKGRIPKYNPEKRKAIWDWLEVCENTSAAFLERGLGESEIFRWIKDVGTEEKPKKSDQDKLDACLCLVVALDLAERKDCLMVGEMESGYMVVPYIDEVLQKELEERCVATGRKRSEWVHKFKLSAS